MQINEPDPDPKRGSRDNRVISDTARAGWYYGLLTCVVSAAKSSSSQQGCPKAPEGTMLSIRCRFSRFAGL